MPTEENPKATKMMRIARVTFLHVVPGHILEGLNQSYSRPISTSPVIKMTVQFSDNGEPYGVTFRLNGCTLGFYSITSFSPGPFMNHTPEVVAYLSQAADQALAIVQPVVTLH